METNYREKTIRVLGTDYKVIAVKKGKTTWHTHGELTFTGYSGVEKTVPIEARGGTADAAFRNWEHLARTTADY